MSTVLMVTLVYGPDTVSTAKYMTDIALGLQNAGHDVTVLTSIPHYNPSSEVRANPIYTVNLRRPYTESFEEGVRVFRVLMPMKGQRVWARIFDYLLFQTLTTILALVKLRKQDVVFVTSPPITFGITGYIISRFLRAAFVYDVRELWPDVPVHMGLLRNRALIRMAYAIENFVYRNATAISVIGRSFIDALVARGVPAKKLYFTPNFVDIDWLTPREKDNPIARAFGLHDKFVILYAGNIGLTQGLEILIHAARAFEDDEKVRIVIVGGGSGKAQLEAEIDASGLSNIQIHPYLPWNDVPNLYATADICVSPLRAGFAFDTIPSKLYSIMAAGRPIIAAGETGTETAALIETAQAGLCIPPESSHAMIAAIAKLRNASDVRQKFGRKGRAHVVDNYSRDAVTATYEKMIRDVANR